jgi:hypothetical protein
MNCGACGNYCPQGMFCGGGKCQMGMPAPSEGGQPPPPYDGGMPPMCGPGQSFCAPPGAPGYCTDLGRDRYNCGGCGKSCAANELCNGGTCAPDTFDGGPPPPPPPSDGGTCGQPFTTCSSPAGPFCADLAHDRYHCGSCDVGCTANDVCMDGRCVIPPPPPDGAPPPPMCQPPANPCMPPTGGPPYCADFSIDHNNCGGCGIVCAANQVCMSGRCVTPPPPPPMCQPPSSPCQPPQAMGYCADFNVDHNNCGGCQLVCSVDQVCMGGKCTVPPPPPMCQPPLSPCQPPQGMGYCANLAVDNFNCGMCGKPCAGATTCQMGMCK